MASQLSRLLTSGTKSIYAGSLRKWAFPKFSFASGNGARYSNGRRPATTPSGSQNGQCLLTYVWVDGTHVHLRAKTLVTEKEPREVKDIPNWNFDGSSTYQAETGDSDMTLKPVAMCRDPFLTGKAKLVLCEVLKDGQPLAGFNYRDSCAQVAEDTKQLDPWFAFEQEYTLFSRLTGKPYGWPPGDGLLAPQGPYYCGVGAGAIFGREIVEKHLQACLNAGLRIGGTNAEVMPSQWEFQIGPLPPLAVADQLWLCRYILCRVAEDYEAVISLDPKPLPGWNGAGNHCNFSTILTRSENGMEYLEEAVQKLSRAHAAHIEVYDPSGGIENRRRLTGKFETASIDKFTSGVGSRNVSVRIPRPVAVAGKGHLEDRRPSSNCDPYRVVERILRTTCLDA